MIVSVKLPKKLCDILEKPKAKFIREAIEKNYNIVLDLIERNIDCFYVNGEDYEVYLLKKIFPEKEYEIEEIYNSEQICLSIRGISNKILAKIEDRIEKINKKYKLRIGRSTIIRFCIFMELYNHSKIFKNRSLIQYELIVSKKI